MEQQAETEQLQSPAAAVNYIYSYFNLLGVDTSTIDFSKRPKGLPDDVNKAWDILEAEQEEYTEAYGAFTDGEGE